MFRQLNNWVSSTSQGKKRSSEHANTAHNLRFTTRNHVLLEFEDLNWQSWQDANPVTYPSHSQHAQVNKQLLHCIYFNSSIGMRIKSFKSEFFPWQHLKLEVCQ